MALARIYLVCYNHTMVPIESKEYVENEAQNLEPNTILTGNTLCAIGQTLSTSECQPSVFQFALSRSIVTAIELFACEHHQTEFCLFVPTVRPKRYLRIKI